MLFFDVDRICIAKGVIKNFREYPEHTNAFLLALHLSF